MAVGGIANAATVQLSTGVLLVKQSSNETVKRGTGAGILMPRLAALGSNKLMAIWMDSAPDSIVPQSDANDNNGYWEGKVSVIQLNAEAAPTIVNTQQFTSFTGDRPFNHPRHAAGSTGDYVIIGFASTLEDPDTTNAYVMALDGTGHVMSLTGKSLNGDNQVTDSNGKAQPVLNIGQNDGDDHGASDIEFSSVDSSGVDHFVGTYQHNNNDIYAYGLAVTHTATSVNVVESWKTKSSPPQTSAAGRAPSLPPRAKRAARPRATTARPNRHRVRGPRHDERLGHQQVDGSRVGARPERLHEQPTITYLGNNTCGLGIVMSDGQGRNKNGHFQGTNTSMAYTIDCNALSIKNTQTGVAPFQRHATMSSSVFGNQGRRSWPRWAARDRRRRGGPAAHRRRLERDDVGRQAEQHAPRHVAVRHRVAVVQGPAQPEQPGPRLPPHARRRGQPGLPGPEGLDAGGLELRRLAGPRGVNSTAIRNSLFMSFIPIAWDKSVQVTMGGAVDVSQIPAGPSPVVGEGSGAPVVGGGDPNVNGDQSGTGSRRLDGFRRQRPQGRLPRDERQRRMQRELGRYVHRGRSRWSRSRGSRSRGGGFAPPEVTKMISRALSVGLVGALCIGAWVGCGDGASTGGIGSVGSYHSGSGGPATTGDTGSSGGGSSSSSSSSSGSSGGSSSSGSSSGGTAEAGAPAGEAGPAPVTLEEALTQFAACMSYSDFTAKTSNGYAAADVAKNRAQYGDCNACHNAGDGGFWASYGTVEGQDMTTVMFQNTQQMPYILKWVTGTVDTEGNFKGLAPSNAIADQATLASQCAQGTPATRSSS